MNGSNSLQTSAKLICFILDRHTHLPAKGQFLNKNQLLEDNSPWVFPISVSLNDQRH